LVIPLHPGTGQASAAGARAHLPCGLHGVERRPVGSAAKKALKGAPGSASSDTVAAAYLGEARGRALVEGHQVFGGA